jgi:NAD(P)-dependent dehydrogenase (short-subunit alcohol dehydrogenase family)
MARCAADFLASAGGVDLVFANAGVGIANRVLEGESREIAWLMNVNVIGVTNTVVPFIPHMIEQGSGILCAVGSMAGNQPLPGRAAYSASKACVRTFMSALRMDLHGTGVHAMTLCPGFVETPLTEGQKGMMFVIDVPHRGPIHGPRDRGTQAHLHIPVADERAQGGDGARPGARDPDARTAGAVAVVELKPHSMKRPID